MRRLLGLLIVTAIATLSAGCIRSIHPLYTEQDVIFDPDLIGQWSENDSKGTWAFSKFSENKYQLVYTDDKGQSGTFVVHLVKIDGKRFLDLFPADSENTQNDYYQFHLLPVHTFAWLKQINPTLQMSFPEPDWLKKLLAEDPDAIGHEKMNDEIIVTAPTEVLQAFFLKHLDTEGAFDKPSDMTRAQADILQ